MSMFNPSRSTAIVLVLGLLAPVAAESLAQPASALERRALAAARDTVETPDRFEPETVRIAGEAPGADGDFELIEVVGPNQSGVVRLTFAAEGTEGPREVYATVRGSVRGPALVATQTVGRGEAISTSSVERREADLTRLRHEPLREAADLANLVPVRTLGVGRVLTADLLEPIPLVRRNQAVTLEVVRPGLLVTATGTALADGAAGDSIVAINDSTGTRVRCEVQADGSLRVIGALTGGRRR